MAPSPQPTLIRCNVRGRVSNFSVTLREVMSLTASDCPALGLGQHISGWWYTYPSEKY